MLANAFPQKTILIRPHPVAIHEPWQEITSRHANKYIAAEGNVVPWLMACRALVHNGSTTAAAATALRKPTIASQLVPWFHDDKDLANTLSHDIGCPARITAECLMNETCTDCGIAFAVGPRTPSTECARLASTRPVTRSLRWRSIQGGRSRRAPSCVHRGTTGGAVRGEAWPYDTRDGSPPYALIKPRSSSSSPQLEQPVVRRPVHSVRRLRFAHTAIAPWACRDRIRGIRALEP